MANDLLRCKSNYRKQILYILLTIVVSLIFAVILSWLGYYFRDLYKIPVESDLIGLLGNISSGIIGGVGTIIAVILSISKTDEIQRLHELEYKKDKQQLFSNEIMDLISKYITDISGYYYSCRRQILLQDRLDNTKDEFEKTKLKIELEKLRINRSIAIECRYSLILRLQDNKSAEELLRYLNKVHNEISVDEDIKEKEFNDHINNLIVITYNFCRDYVDNSNINKTQ